MADAEGVSTLATGRWDRFRKFVRRNDTLLTLFGSLIVLISFVVKEQLQESYRERLSSVHLAQVDYNISGSLHRNEQIIISILQDVQNYLEHPKFRERLQSKTDFGCFAQNAASIDAHSGQLAEAHNYLIRAGADNDQLNHHYKRLERLRIQILSKGVDSLSKCVDEKNMGDPQVRNIADFEMGSYHYIESVAPAVDEYENALVRRSHTAGSVGTIIFLLGWALGLIGKLAGKTEEANE